MGRIETGNARRQKAWGLWTNRWQTWDKSVADLERDDPHPNGTQKQYPKRSSSSTKGGLWTNRWQTWDKSVADLERDDHDNGADPHPNGTQNSTQKVVVVDNGADPHPNGTQNSTQNVVVVDNGADPHPNGTQNSTQKVVVVDKRGLWTNRWQTWDKSVADLERDDHDNGADPHPNGTQNSTQKRRRRRQRRRPPTQTVLKTVPKRSSSSTKGAEASSAPSVLVANLFLSQFIIDAICTVSVNYESVLVANRSYLSLLSVQFALSQ